MSHHEIEGVRFKLDADGYVNELDAKDRVVPPHSLMDRCFPCVFTGRGFHAPENTTSMPLCIGLKRMRVVCTPKVMIMGAEPRVWVLDEPEFLGPFEVRAKWEDYNEKKTYLVLEFFIDGVQVLPVPYGLVEDAAHRYIGCTMILPCGVSKLRVGDETLEIDIVYENWRVEEVAE